MAWATLISTVVAAIAVVGSLLFLAKQVRFAARVSAFETNAASTDRLDAVTALLVDRPYLWKYFYENAEVPAEGATAVQATAVAQMFADAIAGGLYGAARITPSALAPMEDFARFMLDHSPALKKEVEEHPAWWPWLLAILRDRRA